MKAGACDIAAAAAPDDDFDTLIDAVKKADSVCSFAKCKASVLTLGQLCLFCNRQYCLSHHIPEVRHRQGGKKRAVVFINEKLKSLNAGFCVFPPFFLGSRLWR